jgi:hypothetical protein
MAVMRNRHKFGKLKTAREMAASLPLPLPLQAADGGFHASTDTKPPHSAASG